MPRYAPLELILPTLETILLPSPISAHLPFALKLLAHLQLLDRQLVHEARRVLDAHTQLLQQIKSDFDDADDRREQAVRTGVLNELEMKLVKRIIKRGQMDEDVLFVASVELRHWHISQLLNSPLPLETIQPVIDGYFPPSFRETTDQGDIKPRTSAPLYIKSMTTDERRSCAERQRFIDSMVKLRREGKALTANSTAQSLSVSDIVSIALRAARVIQDDTAALKAAFPCARGKSSRRATASPHELHRNRPTKRARHDQPSVRSPL